MFLEDKIVQLIEEKHNDCKTQDDDLMLVKAALDMGLAVLKDDLKNIPKLYDTESKQKAFTKGCVLRINTSWNSAIEKLAAKDIFVLKHNGFKNVVATFDLFKDLFPENN